MTYHLVQSLDTSGGFLRDTLNIGDNAVPEAGLLLGDLLKELIHDGQLLVVLIIVEDGRVILGLITTVDEQSGITTIVNDEFGTLSVREDEGAQCAIPVLLEALALPGEDRGLPGSNSGGSMILGAENVAAGPPDVGSDGLESLNQHSGLDGHVQRSANAHTFERLFCSVLLTSGHQTRHLVFGKSEFAAAKLRQRHVSNFEVTTIFRMEYEGLGLHVLFSCGHGSCGNGNERQKNKNKETPIVLSTDAQ